MKKLTLGDLQESLADKTGFRQLPDYEKFCAAFLAMIGEDRPTRIVSPSHQNYVFYQYSQAHGHAPLLAQIPAAGKENQERICQLVGSVTFR